MPEQKQDDLISAIRGLWPYVRPFKRKFLWGLAIAGALTLVGMLPPLVMRGLVNDVASDGKYGLLPLLIGALFGITLLRAGMTFVNARTIAFVGQRIVRDIRQALYAHLVKLPLRFHDRTPTGAVMQRLMGDVAAVQNLVTGHAITLVVDLVSGSFALFVMIKLSGQLTLLSLALLPIFYLNYRLFTVRIQANNIQLRGQMDHISSMLQERLSSHDLVVSYAQEAGTAHHFRDRTRASRDTALRGIVYNMGFNHATAFINGAGATAIYVAAVYLFLKDPSEFGYGDVVAFAAYSAQLMGPIVRFVQILQQSNQALVSIRRVNQLFNESVEVEPTPGAPVAEDVRGEVRLDSYTYHDPEDGELVLDAVNLEVPAGMNLALVGEPASGKSTLLAAIRRMIDPDEGSLHVNGKDVRELDLLDYQRSVPAVRDSTAIFRGSIGENLRYGRPDAPDEELMEALRVVEMDGFVGDLSEGLYTLIGPGGIRLSAGQRQRLGIARALIVEPKMLILDEATAALDPQSAADLLNALFEHLPDTTIFSVARRLGVARETEIIAVMQNGKVVESATHDALMAQPEGEYRKLYELQYGKIVD